MNTMGCVGSSQTKGDGPGISSLILFISSFHSLFFVSNLKLQVRLGFICSSFIDAIVDVFREIGGVRFFL